ncbi:MAG: hypothetical protein AB7I48_01570 [Planctomycetaceae bacterium]
MRFTVTWQRVAEDKLAALWTGAEDRQAIADAVDQIDRMLRFEGDRVGRDFLEYHFLAAGPLAVIFTRSLDDRLIDVIDILITSRRRA